MRNLLERLRDREKGGASPLPGGSRSHLEDFIPFTTPQSTLWPIRLPMDVHIVRSFSPDGKHPPSALRHNHPLYSIRLYCLNLETLSMKYVWQFPEDWLDLEDGRCCSLEGDTLSVLSLQDQTVYLFHWREDGQLDPLRRLGSHLTEKDKEEEEKDDLIFDGESSLEGISTVLHNERILTHLYRKAMKSGNQEQIQYFHQIRPQLIDDVVLTYAHLVGPTGRYLQLHYQPQSIIAASLHVSAPHPPTSLMQPPSHAPSSSSFSGPFVIEPPFKSTSPHLPAISTPFSVLYDMHDSVILKILHRHAFPSGISIPSRGSSSYSVPSPGQKRLDPGMYKSPYLSSNLFTYEESLLLGRAKPQQIPEAPMRVKYADTGDLAFSIHLRSLILPHNGYIGDRIRLVLCVG
ncbi:hypothetical protein BJ684DRAFT_18456 [Piptocephalis cylindrospora]|uniref:Uncharacterized protein n=1 Tax=Piptocephalis cylindrospora TaxID=1907219 RepID=A0A4P9Y7T3_9FUNG|nr:hypothetical protein BJ684DRAFT_18456 [Piptocephalis cylindrospora]|eukprot:RKP15206.1 hypothetical protein BJ684DRAFT_18456 [Piptocephalis cylindrospora]